MQVTMTRKLQVLNDDRALRREFGQLAPVIKRRLVVLRAARSLAAVPRTRPERCHQLHRDRDEFFAVDLKEQWRMIFEVDHAPIPRRRDGGIDLTAVTSIRITEISDHYK
jgi:proteic killer suppression protein